MFAELIYSTMEKIAVFPGSFDPFTVGHEEIVRRGLKLFDKIIIAVGVNPGKRHGQRCNPIARHGEIVPQCSGRHVRLKTEVTAAARKNLIGLDATGLAMCPPMSFSVK